MFHVALVYPLDEQSPPHFCARRAVSIEKTLFAVLSPIQNAFGMNIIMSTTGTKIGLLLLCMVTRSALSIRDSSSRRHQRPRNWNLPPHVDATLPGRNFMQECESLAAFVARIRGGSDPYYSSDYGRRRDSYRYDDNDSQRDDYYNYGQDDDDSNDDGDRNEGDYDDYGYYDGDPAPRGRSRNSRSSPSGPNVASAFQSLPNIPSVIQYGDRRIGLALLGSGMVVTMLGVSLFFNKTLMRMGNLLFIGGVPMMLGPSRTLGYFLKPEKFRATACLGLGIFLVLIGSPVFGIALEIFGLLNLFGNMFPVLMAVAKQLPVVGPILSGNNSKNSGNGNNNRYNARRRGYDDRSQDRYNDDRYNDNRGYDEDYYEDDFYRREEYGRDNRYSDY